MRRTPTLNSFFGLPPGEKWNESASGSKPLSHVDELGDLPEVLSLHDKGQMVGVNALLESELFGEMEPFAKVFPLSTFADLLVSLLARRVDTDCDPLDVSVTVRDAVPLACEKRAVGS